MSLTVFSLVLLAALLHAVWNAIVKGGGDKWLSTVLIAGFGALAALPFLPFLPLPARASWPFIAVSAMCQWLYYLLLARAYRIADMSQIYPLMRGTAPILVTLAGLAGMGEVLSDSAFLGVGVICLGILGMAAGLRRGEGAAGVPVALANALVIACYTLIDGMGVRRAGMAASYVFWHFLVSGLPLLAWAFAVRGRVLQDYARRYWRFGLVGGVGSLAAYGLVLWAMTQAPVAVVAALRETSILFGALISWLFLHELVGPRRMLAIGMIAAGAVVLRLG